MADYLIKGELHQNNDSEEVEFVGIDPGISGVAPIPRKTLESVDSSSDDEFEPDDLAIADLLEEYSDDSGVMVRIYRQGAAYRDQTFLDECAPSDFSPKMLQEKFGGGKFRIHARSKKGIVLNRALQVAPPINKSADQDDKLAPMRAQIEALTVLVRQSMTPRHVEVGASRKEMLEEMIAMKELFGTARQERSVDPFDIVSKTLTLSKELGMGGANGGSGGESPDALSVIMRAMEVFGKPLAEAAAARQMQMPLQNQAPLPQQEQRQVPGPVQQPGAYPIEGEMQNQELEMLKHYLRMLMGKAQGNSDPAIYAGLVADNLPDETLNAMLKPDAWFENLCAIEPGLVPFREWFSELRNSIMEILTDEVEVDIPEIINPSGEKNAPAPDPASNAKRNT